VRPGGGVALRTAARACWASLDVAGGPLVRRPARGGASERDVVRIGFVGRGGRGLARLVAAGLWPVFDVGAVQLEREAVVAGAGDELARLEASGEADGLAFDEVLSRRGGLVCQTIRSM
jgi:hypothetical protein